VPNSTSVPGSGVGEMLPGPIAKVAEAYRRDKGVNPVFRLHGAIAYDPRLLSWKDPSRVSVLTPQGRIVVRSL